jgi:hypothetical protein
VQPPIRAQWSLKSLIVSLNGDVARDDVLTFVPFGGIGLVSQPADINTADTANANNRKEQLGIGFMVSTSLLILTSTFPVSSRPSEIIFASYSSPPFWLNIV